MMLRLKLDPPRPYLDRNFNFTIRTGQSQSIANKLATSAVRDPARTARIRQDLEILGAQLAENGASGTFNVPEIVYAAFGELEIVIIYGVVVKGVSQHGRLMGDYFFLMICPDELETVLEDVFKLSEVLRV